MAVSAGANIRGITIKLGGDSSGLVKSFKDVNQAAKNTSNALKDVERLLKFDSGNVTLLKQKQDLLNRSYEETSQRLTEVKAIRDKLEANNEGEKNQRQIEAVNREIEELEYELDQVKTKASNFSVLGSQIEAFGSKVSAASEKIRNVGQTMTTYITLPLVAIGTAAFKAASDYEENLNKVDVAFGKNADSVKEWAKTATEAFGLSESHALEATALFGDMGTSMGLSTKEAAEMSISLAGLAGDLASFKNISQDQAFKALESVFTGETESLKKLGIVMTQTNLEEFASRQNKVYKELSESEQVMLRYEYVMDKTKNAQGDYSRTADGAANVLKTFREEVDNLMVAIGQNLLPVITPIVQNLTEMVKAFGQLDPAVQKNIVQAGLAIAVLGPLLQVIGSIGMGAGTLIGMGGKLVGFFTGTKVAAAATTTAVSGTGAAMNTAAAASTAAAAKMTAAGAASSSGLLATAAAATGVGGAAVLAAGSVGAAAIQITSNWSTLKDTFKIVGDYNTAKANQMAAETKLAAVKQQLAIKESTEATKKDVENGYKGVKDSINNNLSASQSSINLFGSNTRNTFNTTFSNIQSRTAGSMINIRSSIQNGIGGASSSASSSMNTLKNTVLSANTEMQRSSSNSWASIKKAVTDSSNDSNRNALEAWGSIETNTTTKFNSVDSATTSSWSSIKGTIHNTVVGIKGDFVGDNSTLGSAISAYSKKMDAAKSETSNAWTGTAGAEGIVQKSLLSMENAAKKTNLKIGSVTVPTFSWSGTNDSTKGTTAKITVGSKIISSYAKGMFGGAILKGATIFGAMGDKLLQAGEVGSEVVVGTNSLMNMIARTSRANSNNTAVISGLGAIYTLLAQYLPESAENKAVVLDNGKLVGALVPAINRQLGLMMG